MLHFVINFMKDRKLKVVLGGETFTARIIENGVVQGAVKLFLVAIK
jgi:hypothetical protein